MDSSNFAPRVDDIRPFQVMELLRRAREMEAAGRDIIHMEVGEPDFPTPAPIVEAATRFISKGHVHYTPALGLTSLREAIARYYSDRYHIDVNPNRIVITAGASGALLLATAATVRPSGEWLVPDPGYPSNRHLIRAFEGIPIGLPVNAETDFQPTPELIEASWHGQTQGLIVASPSNPTGTVLEPENLKAIHEFTTRKGGNLIVDEIYQGLTYGSRDFTALSCCSHAIIDNSFSKYFGMTGWRLGWLVVPEGTTNAFEKLAQHFFIAPSTVAQYAALAAFTPATQAILEERKQIFSQRRSTLLNGLTSLGIDVPCTPIGAFYAYADVRPLGLDSRAMANHLLEDAGVATTPGLDFGNQDPGRYLRLAYTTDEGRIAEAIERIRGRLF